MGRKTASAQPSRDEVEHLRPVPNGAPAEQTHQSGTRWHASPLVVVVVLLALADVLMGPDANLGATFSIAPFLTGNGAKRRQTAMVAVVAALWLSPGTGVHTDGFVEARRADGAFVPLEELSEVLQKRSCPKGCGE